MFSPRCLMLFGICLAFAANGLAAPMQSSDAGPPNLWFGVKGIDIAEVDRTELLRNKIPTTKGILVKLVAYGSPAATAGIKVGDILKTAGETQIESAEDLVAAIASSKPGQEIEFKVLRLVGRRTKVKRIKVTLREILPLAAKEHIQRGKFPDEVKEALERQLVNYRDMLEMLSEAATGEGDYPASAAEPAKSLVKAMLESGPYTIACTPKFGREVPVEVGNIGKFGEVELLQVIDDETVMFEIGNAMIIMPLDATNLSDGDTASPGVAQISGTTNYTTVLGAAKKAFVAKPFDLESYFPKKNEGP